MSCQASFFLKAIVILVSNFHTPSISYEAFPVKSSIHAIPILKQRKNSIINISSSTIICKISDNLDFKEIIKINNNQKIIIYQKDQVKIFALYDKMSNKPSTFKLFYEIFKDIKVN